MKKAFKIFFIIIINICILISALFLSDWIIYKVHTDPVTYYEHHPLSTDIPKFQYMIKDPFTTFIDLEDYYTGDNNIFVGRLPNGLQYKDKTPILIFGDSFAHGQYLNPDQNFSHKLSESLKRPVYNRGIPGSSMQHMLHQVTVKADDFFQKVPKTDTVFYVFIDEHYMRMSIFSDFDALYNNLYLRYTLRDGKLVKDNYDNKFLNFIKSSYTIRMLSLKHTVWYINNPKMADKLTDQILAFFIETRDALEKKWENKINFTVLLYDNIPIKNKAMLRKKLEDNNFNVIDTSDLTKEDLNIEKYLMQDNLHPTEAAWDLLTPKIIKELGLK